ncbi:hypothetical protein yc1106_09789 [Curvularia clavata]|uniref:Uncharacterized protein n=1 Tax=Curvularia clavata TaxID=95742 RepID=A0A9Q8ZHX6_CURCL|nr:hypothetical protein yc1106_09789 [Curvularia clavata]
MACGGHTIKCKSCTTVLAAVTSTGLTPVPSLDDSGCSTCERFSTLYDAVQAADAEWATFENKRDSITKSFARDKHKRARMEFDNWLMTVEALPTTRTEECAARLDDATPEAQTLLFHGSQEPKPTITRRRSHSPTTQHTTFAEELSDPRPQQLNDASLSFRPSPKRSRSTNSVSGRKRLKFSDTVEFHETYRSSEEYHRPSEQYVRGRNAPPEGSEYMDTSGSGQTFLRFTQMKKVGAKWVELSEEELAKKNKSLGPAPAQQQPVAAESQETKGNATDALERNGVAPSDARAARLARRAREASGINSAQPRNTRRATNRSSKIARQVEDGTPAGIEKSSAGPTAPSSSKTVEAKATITDEGVNSPKEIRMGQDGMKKASITTIEKASIEAMRNDEIQEPQSYHGGLHLNTPSSGTGADRSEAIERDTKIMETTRSPPAVAENHPQTNERAIQTSCIGWQDAYASTALDGRNVTATIVGEDPKSQIDKN